MHVIVATDGSKQSLAAAKHLKSFADPAKITDVSVVAVIRPLASVAFADDLSARAKWPAAVVPRRRRERRRHHRRGLRRLGPKVHKRIRSGSAANEIIKAAKQYDAGLVVVAAGGRGLSDSVLVGSTAQRVQHYAPCPVLVVRPAPRPRKARTGRTAR